MTARPPAAPSAFLAEVRAALGPDAVVTDPEVLAAHGVDWTGRFTGTAPAAVRPGDAVEAAEVVAAARRHGVALVPQGGNTGLVGGATPCDGEVVVDLRRITGVRDLDAAGGQLTAGAGTTIAAVQQAAAAIGWAYGVDWAARDSATIGGSVATDAGGLRFIRHGSTRRQLLGITAVLGTGEVASHLPAVQKDNTGYDLAAVLCGSEGTLGIVTDVRVRLVAPPQPAATALVAFASVTAAVEAASVLRRGVTGLDAVELVLAAGLGLVAEVHGLVPPFDPLPPAALLVELSAPSGAADLLGEAVAGLAGVVDAAVAVDGPRRRELWRWRELHTESINHVGTPHKLDVTLPADELAGFVADVPGIVADAAPGARTWLFGHAADGNVHVNITGAADDDEEVDDAVFRAVAERRGSISAEHGIGRAKRRWLPLAQDAGSIAAMRRLKDAFDPDGICNPAVLLPPR